MSKKKQKEQQGTEENPILQAADLPVTIHTQYIRDMSFENPSAPRSLQAGQDLPEMDVNITMDARTLPDDTEGMYEVVLTLSAQAVRNGGTVFIAEITYGACVSIGESVPEDAHHPMLLIEIPRFMFPFARQILATMTAQGGYPPLLLTPVDFQALYMERFKNEIAAAKQDAAQDS